MCGFGFVINGAMVDAIAVDKDKARVAFETEVRRGGKAALVEVVKGNSFKTRIYPIPPNQITTIKVQYTADIQLTETGEGEFIFPVKTEQMLPLLKLRIEVREPKPPKVKGKLKVKDFAEQDKEIFVVIQISLDFDLFLQIEEDIKQISMDDNLTILLNQIPQCLISCGHREIDNLDYFVVSEVPKIPESKQEKKSKFNRVGVFWVCNYYSF